MQSCNKRKLIELNKIITDCNICERLFTFRNKIAAEKRKMYNKEVYWGKPVSGFGDINAQILIIGLAPAAHGGNRTGRVFTGDKASDFLFKCLGSVGLSNQDFSISKNDNLKLYNAYLTLSLKCVPPEDKPTKKELFNCSSFLQEELKLLQNVKVIVALGKVAFDSIVLFYKKNYEYQKKGVKFMHGKYIKLPDKKILISCYHPSPRNVNTGRINMQKFIKLFRDTTKLLS